ncbi:MAG: tRNA 4-thiouridine(8) synthase ThiI [Patescibacteria group bacterium]|nr:tRNA 4-thiouridine(8) synthase ThiI [Patescibacteria group bacterium]
MTQQIGVPLRTIDFSELHLGIVKDPKHGYGKNMNPCIDCHGAMFAHAVKIMDAEGFDCISTGEILGQRPMSQNKQALGTVDRIAVSGGRLIRPLCAKNLPETEVEKSGLIDREQLLDLHGRNRKPQIAMAKEWNIVEYPSPAGGCQLTDPGYSKRLKDYLEHYPQAKREEIAIIKYGRHIWQENSLIMIGRNKEDNELLTSNVIPGDTKIYTPGIPGPSVVIRFATPESIEHLKETLPTFNKKLQAAIEE